MCSGVCLLEAAKTLLVADYHWNVLMSL